MAGTASGNTHGPCTFPIFSLYVILLYLSCTVRVLVDTSIVFDRGALSAAGRTLVGAGQLLSREIDWNSSSRTMQRTSNGHNVTYCSRWFFLVTSLHMCFWLYLFLKMPRCCDSTEGGSYPQRGDGCSVVELVELCRTSLRASKVWRFWGRNSETWRKSLEARSWDPPMFALNIRSKDTR